MYEFWYDYVKAKHEEKAKLGYMDKDSCIVYIKTEDIYSDIAKDIETRNATSNYKLHRPLPEGKIKRSNWFNKRWIRQENNETNCGIKGKRI